MTSPDPINRFSIQRFLLVCKRFAILHQRSWTIGFAAAFGLLLLAWLIPFLFTFTMPDPPGFGQVAGTAMFFYALGGCVLTSTLYSELHTRTTAFQLLTLPVNRLEVLLAGWMIGAVFYSIAALTLIFLLSAVIGGLSALTLETWAAFQLFDPFEAEVLTSVHAYLLYQSIFLLGAIHFRGKNFLKTILAVIVLFISLVVLLGLTAYVVQLAIGDQLFVQWIEGFSNWMERMARVFSGETASRILRHLFWLITIAALLSFSYFRLKRKQVS